MMSVIDSPFSTSTRHKNIDYSHQTLTHKQWQEHVFEECDFTEARFEHCNISLTEFKNCRLFDVTFVGCKVVGVNFSDNSMIFPTTLGFVDCVISQSTFQLVSFLRSTVKQCDAIGADFFGADMRECDCHETNFDGAIFTNTKLQKADFRGAGNYYIDVRENPSLIKGALFSSYEVHNLLKPFDIIIE